MKINHPFFLALSLAAALSASLFATPGSGQDFGEPDVPPAATSTDDAYYSGTARRGKQPTIAQEKAMQRGQQRMARLEALRWYGFSNSRPTAATMPFTTMYSPSWQQPGGRPFAWYTSSRPIFIYTSTQSVVR